MVLMPPEHHLNDLDASAPVVEFGSAAPPPRRRLNLAGLGRGLVTDRRVVPLAAALGAIALLASLVSEWQVTTVASEALNGDSSDGATDLGSRIMGVGVTDSGALGAGYLIGLFPLIAALVLTVFGPPAGRRYARLAGLSVGGTLAGVLFALYSSLGEQSRLFTDVYLIAADSDHIRVAYGRGLWCAFGGVALMLFALYRAGLGAPAPAVGAAEGDPGAIWSWRRPPASEQENGPDEPLELTVGPTTPFNPRGGDRDKPSQS